MQVLKEETESHYSSGFKKKVVRTKHNLVLNDRLKSARNRKGISSAGVVEALKQEGIHIGHSTLQGYEANENSLNHRYPSLMALLQLADFYEVSLDYLFGITDRFSPSQISSDSEDIRDVLESQQPVMYNGSQLTTKQRASIVTLLDRLLAN